MLSHILMFGMPITDIVTLVVLGIGVLALACVIGYFFYRGITKLGTKYAAQLKSEEIQRLAKEYHEQEVETTLKRLDHRVEKNEISKKAAEEAKKTLQEAIDRAEEAKATA